MQHAIDFGSVRKVAALAFAILCMAITAIALVIATYAVASRYEGCSYQLQSHVNEALR